MKREQVSACERITYRALRRNSAILQEVIPSQALRRMGVVMVMVVLVMAGCTQAGPTPVSEVPAPTSVQGVDEPTVPAPAATHSPQATTGPAATAQQEPTAAAVPTETATAQPTAEPGPADLLAGFTAAPTAQGDVVLLTGRVLDTNGNPIPDAAVEIWHTDVNGIYDHPGDRSTGNRDRGFQFYGTSISDDSGTYAFRTIMPGEYEPRPRHIHVKVKQNGRELLTTQFYFEEDRALLAQEGIFAQAGDQGERLILKAVDNLPGVTARVLSSDLVIDTGSGAGSLTRTPAQTEGPYYPRVNVADFNNDLAVVP